MPALQVDAAIAARDVISVISRAAGSARYNNINNTARTGRRVLGAGIIAAIVISSLVFIGLLICGICLFRRHKSQRKRHDKEMQKYYGDGRSSIGTNNTADYGNNPLPGQGGYNYAGQGQGYGYGNAAAAPAPGQYGYGGQNNGVSGMPPAHTADHVHATK